MQNHYNLRKKYTFRISYFNTVFKRKESVFYLGLKTQKQVSEEIKSLESLVNFKKAI